MRITWIAMVLTLSFAVIARVSAADTDDSKATAPSRRTAAQDGHVATKRIPPCGPEVAAVLGGEDDTACLPHDIGEHGRATVPRGVTGSSSGTQSEHQATSSPQ